MMENLLLNEYYERMSEELPVELVALKAVCPFPAVAGYSSDAIATEIEDILLRRKVVKSWTPLNRAVLYTDGAKVFMIFLVDARGVKNCPLDEVRKQGFVVRIPSKEFMQSPEFLPSGGEGLLHRGHPVVFEGYGDLVGLQHPFIKELVQAN